jgi:hypothetical protein
MSVEVSKFGRLARRLTLIVFALWLAGAGHLVCCGSACAVEAFAASASELSHERAPDAVGAADACCHARIRHEHHAGSQRGLNAASSESDPASTLTTPLPASQVASRCCSSAGQVADRTTRPRITNDTVGASAPRHSSRANIATTLDDSSSRVSRLLDRGGTYLRGCAFLI